jgi:hypothetical protein
MWALYGKGRFIEYLAFTWYKPIQDYYQKPLIISGCFSMYRTQVLKENGGWYAYTCGRYGSNGRSEKGHGVRFIPEAVLLSIEPHNFTFMQQAAALVAWFCSECDVPLAESPQNKIPQDICCCHCEDAVVASLTYLFLLPLIAILFAIRLY